MSVRSYIYNNRPDEIEEEEQQSRGSAPSPGPRPRQQPNPNRGPSPGPRPGGDIKYCTNNVLISFKIAGYQTTILTYVDR